MGTIDFCLPASQSASQLVGACQDSVPSPVNKLGEAHPGRHSIIATTSGDSWAGCLRRASDDSLVLPLMKL